MDFTNRLGAVVNDLMTQSRKDVNQPPVDSAGHGPRTPRCGVEQTGSLLHSPGRAEPGFSDHHSRSALHP